MRLLSKVEFIAKYARFSMPKEVLSAQKHLLKKLRGFQGWLFLGNLWHTSSTAAFSERHHVLELERVRPAHATVKKERSNLQADTLMLRTVATGEEKGNPC